MQGGSLQCTAGLDQEGKEPRLVHGANATNEQCCLPQN